MGTIVEDNKAFFDKVSSNKYSELEEKESITGKLEGLNPEGIDKETLGKTLDFIKNGTDTNITNASIPLDKINVTKDLSKTPNKDFDEFVNKGSSNNEKLDITKTTNYLIEGSSVLKVVNEDTSNNLKTNALNSVILKEQEKVSLDSFVKTSNSDIKNSEDYLANVSSKVELETHSCYVSSISSTKPTDKSSSELLTKFLK